MSDKDQEAWDRFAEAALIPLTDYGLIGNQSIVAVCEQAGLYADAMMAERDKRIKGER